MSLAIFRKDIKNLISRLSKMSSKSDLKRAINTYLRDIASARAVQDTSAKHRADVDFLDKLKPIIDRTQINSVNSSSVNVNQLNDDNIDTLVSDVCNFINHKERSRIIESLRSSDVPERIRYFLDRLKAHGITEQLVENSRLRLAEAIKAKEDALGKFFLCIAEVERIQCDLVQAQKVLENDIASKKHAKLIAIEAQENELKDKLALLAEQKKNL